MVKKQEQHQASDAVSWAAFLLEYYHKKGAIPAHYDVIDKLSEHAEEIRTQTETKH